MGARRCVVNVCVSSHGNAGAGARVCAHLRERASIFVCGMPIVRTKAFGLADRSITPQHPWVGGWPPRVDGEVARAGHVLCTSQSSLRRPRRDVNWLAGMMTWSPQRAGMLLAREKSSVDVKSRAGGKTARTATGDCDWRR